jgi:hypothetical protein
MSLLIIEVDIDIRKVSPVEVYKSLEQEVMDEGIDFSNLCKIADE